ncbi:putative acyltransferase [Synechococcus sp. PCC 7502]|uniref:GNAT family N-acetyltransferase n=1 Tax=Synechococcus sp. PCC 7502 TaxID=1173263 RepID=UPI00029FF2DB|nr:GNAT family N-acetyltransferase [Synechococcus sp. PCC 7502]AFY74403.1 putative acyltransferase [Synechococcus sp. PCC 7502]
MINATSLPQGCVLRRAQAQDKWYLQKLVWQFEIEEVLELDARVLFYRFLTLLAAILLLILQISLLEFASVLLKLLLTVGIIYNSFLIIAVINSLVIIILNIFLGAAINWSRFWVIEYEQELIGCASVNFYYKNSSLGYLYISPRWRNQGLGSYLLTYLIRKSSHPISLICKPKLVEFYATYGFMPVAWENISPSLKNMYNIFRPHPKLIGCPLVLMEYRHAP